LVDILKVPLLSHPANIMEPETNTAPKINVNNFFIRPPFFKFIFFKRLRCLSRPWLLQPRRPAFIE
jgi:hypothetical protein